MYHQVFLTFQNCAFCPVCLRVLCGSHNKRRLFPYTALSNLVFIPETECLLRGTDWVINYKSGWLNKTSTFSPHTVCFVWISEQTAIISLCSINRLIFITETECLLRGTDWVFNDKSGSLNKASTFSPQCICVFCVDVRTNSHYFPTQH